jgi:peptidylprolyl isomerase
MAQVKDGDTVKVHYTGKLNDGTVFDSSLEREPLEVTLGGGQLIAGFEKGLVGMELEESRTINIKAADAYGPVNDDAVMKVDREQLPADLKLEEGLQLNMQNPQGGAVVVTVTEFSETEVTLDANHPLAGKDLTFDLQVVSIVPGE